MIKSSKSFFNNKENKNKITFNNIIRLSSGYLNKENKKFENNSLYKNRIRFQSQDNFFPNIKINDILKNSQNKVDQKLINRRYYITNSYDKKKYFSNKIKSEINNENTFFNNNLFKSETKNIKYRINKYKSFLF